MCIAFLEMFFLFVLGGDFAYIIYINSVQLASSFQLYAPLQLGAAHGQWHHYAVAAAVPAGCLLAGALDPSRLI